MNTTAVTATTKNGTDTILNNKSRYYQPKDEVWFDDGREERLRDYVKDRLDSNSSNPPQDVIRLIDDFGINHNYMMNVGERKGKIVTELIAKYKPKKMIELGGYVGYSTILFASALRDCGGSEYISFEREPKFASVASTMVDLAGLSNIVRFVVGPSSSSLINEHSEGRLDHLDMVFLDHHKPSYVKDLKILESLGVIQEGIVLVADNIIYPGNPTYISYVRSSPAEKLQLLNSQSPDSGKFPTNTVHQYKKESKTDNIKLPGNPNIQYESYLVHSQEPTGVPDGLEITICKSVNS